MSLHVYPALTQGTDEWLEARRGIITASVVGQLIAPKTLKPASNETARGLALTLIAERITGHVEPVFVSNDMLRGTLEEPIARQAYADFTGVDVQQVGLMVEDRFGFYIGYSPDGLVADGGLIEIKSRRPKKHLQTILADEVPIENMAQIQCGLLVSGREWCDYVSFCGGMRLWTKRVNPDEQWQQAIVTAAEQFELAAADALDTYDARTTGLPMTERSTFDQEIVI